MFQKTDINDIKTEFIPNNNTFCKTVIICLTLLLLWKQNRSHTSNVYVLRIVYLHHLLCFEANYIYNNMTAKYEEYVRTEAS